MRFKIGAWCYRVKIVNEPLCGDDGEQQAGRLCWSDRTIVISAHVPLERRLDTLLHELRHAWTYHLGQPQPGEDDANNASAFAAMAMAELARQGGVAALLRLMPDGRLEHTEDELEQLGEVTAEPYAAQCGRCHRLIARGSVVTQGPTFDDARNRMVLRRQLYCEDCGHVQEWLEAATPSGNPSGLVLSDPVWRRGEAVERFLSENKEFAQ